MDVLTLAAQKGGAGKTTLATSLAAAAASAGLSVVMIDLDPQGSLSDWHARREAQNITRREVRPGQLGDAIAELRQAGDVDLVVVDTAGAFDATVVKALQHSTFTLLPVRPSLLDVTATTRTAEALDKLKRPFGFVLNQVVAASPGRAEDAARALVAVGNLYPALVALRADHLDAMMAGQGVTEWRPASPAAREVEALWAWTKEQLEASR